MSEASLESLPRRRLVRQNGPLYRQLADLLRGPITKGAYPVGAELPKEAALADRFGISLITVRQALRELESDGLIRKRAAKPAVVASRTPRLNFSWSFRNFADIAAYTRNARLTVVSYGQERSALAADVFRLERDAACFCLRGILYVEDRPETQITTYFPPGIGRRLAKADFDDVLIFRSVQSHLGMRMANASITVRAENADAAIAKDLDYAEGAPILSMEMLYRSAELEPVELTIARHRADVFSLSYDAPNDMP